MVSNPLSDKKIEITSGGASLEARLTVLSRTAPLLILAHGFAGNMDEKGLFVGARDFFAGDGFSVLRFDVRVCGDIGGNFRTLRLEDLAVDLTNVIKFARTCDEMRPSAVGLICFSLAAGVAVLANSNQIGAHVFWSPAIYTDRDMVPRYRTPEIDDQILRQGWFTKAGIQVGKQFLEDLNSKRIESSLSRFRHSVLIIHGRDDQRIPSDSSCDLVKDLPTSSQLVLIPGADHSFRPSPSHREWLFSTTSMWLRRRFRKTPVSNNQVPLFEAEADGSARSSQFG